MVRVDTTDAFRVADDLQRLGLHVAAMAPVFTRHYAEILAQSVRAHASGRPGPRVITGEYRSSIEARQSGLLDWEVGTDLERGYRLEFGYVGVDSGGRMRNQRPYPHFRPAADEVESLFEEEMVNLGAGIYFT